MCSWESATEHFKITPAIVKGSALDRMPASQLYETKAVCEHCYNTYEAIGHTRDKVSTFLYQTNETLSCLRVDPKGVNCTNGTAAAKGDWPEDSRRKVHPTTNAQV